MAIAMSPSTDTLFKVKRFQDLQEDKHFKPPSKQKLAKYSFIAPTTKVLQESVQKFKWKFFQLTLFMTDG